MPISLRTCDDGMRVDIIISGKFDYTLAHDFRSIYQGQAEGTSIDYRINLEAAKSLDSTALGMLLLIREHVSKTGGSVVIVNPSESAGVALRTANFQQLFRIDDQAS